MILTMLSCKKEETMLVEPCINCELTIVVDTIVNPGTYIDSNGYTHVKHVGINYFTVESLQSEINPEFVINGVPQVEILWDSDYWILFDTVRFTFPLYSILGNFNSSGTPISTSNGTYYFTNTNPPTNIAGYVYNSDGELGTKTRYSYRSRKSMIFDSEMIGDTATVYAKATWDGNIWGDMRDNKKTVSKTIKVIFE